MVRLQLVAKEITIMPLKKEKKKTGDGYCKGLLPVPLPRLEGMLVKGTMKETFW